MSQSITGSICGVFWSNPYSATIVPFDAGEQANGTATRVPVACGLLLDWQLASDRPAELSAGDRG